MDQEGSLGIRIKQIGRRPMRGFYRGRRLHDFVFFFSIEEKKRLVTLERKKQWKKSRTTSSCFFGDQSTRKKKTLAFFGSLSRAAMNLAASAAHGRVAPDPPRAAAAASNGRRHGRTTTAIAAKHARRQAADEPAATPTSAAAVSRRAALALSLASAASGLLPPKDASAIVDPSAVDQNLEGGTVTLLTVRGDGRDRLSLSEAVVLDTNRKVHAANGAPVDFPGFVRVGFDIKVVVPIEDEEEEQLKVPEGEGEGEGGGEGGGEAAAAAAAAAADETSTSSPADPGAEQAASAESPSPPPVPPPPPPPPRSDASIPLIKGYQITPEGLIFKDYVLGHGESPKDGQEVVFDYTAFNEGGARIDSSFAKGRPASARIGVGAGGGLIPGFELGLLGMRPGGRRRLIVPPALGPPIGPQTFFSAKQCEVFDVQLRAVRSCTRRQVAMFSDVVCE